MNHRVTKSAIGLLACAFTASASAAIGDIAQTPLTVTQSVRPRVMLTISTDHALYYKAYTDWNDLDGNGAPETTYNNGFNYYGYFDPAKCYDYDSTDGRFEPKAVTETHYCDTVDGAWSGNFLNWASMSRMDILRKVLYGGYRSTDDATTTVLERAYIPSDAHSFAKYYNGTDISKLTQFTDSSITLCNTTYAAAGKSQNITDPPQMRVAKGDFRYWAANERWQCTWDTERDSNGSGSNATGSKTADPKYNAPNSDRLGEYNVRVQVCVTGKFGSEDCKRYPDGNYKPVGLLHNYGEEDKLLFGLMTRSYAKNKSGGVLRKNVSSFKDEVNYSTNGTFKTDVTGIVKTLNLMRIVNYDYSDGTYVTADTCDYRLASFLDGKCSNWGNPLSEMYLESLRYMAGLQQPTDAFKLTDTAKDSTYIAGLTSPTWTDPLTAQDWCAHCNVILINASDSSYDDGVTSGGLSGSPDPVALTNAVGTKEGITGHDFFVGENGTDNNQLCTAKTVNALGEVRGACPGAPRLSGTYLLTGLSHWAHTNDVRSAMTGKQTITTRAVTLLPGVPNLKIPVPGSDRTVSILPACRNLDLKPSSPPEGGCAIVDFKIIEQDIAGGTGKVYVNWENGEQGGDFDQDMKGTISYAISGGTITITSDTDAQSADGVRMGFGYVISGTTKDGFHVHSGANGFTYTDTTGALVCNNCQVADEPTSYVYTIGTSSASLLQEPLWYAAKYGSFTDSDKDNDPDLPAEWDADGDRVPDGYFFANNPAELGTSLARFLDVIATTSSSAAVAANSLTLNTSTRIFQARYDSASWTGDLVAFPINADGTLGTAVWHAQDQLDAQAIAGTRRILTTNEATGNGVPFRWGDAASDNDDGIAASQKESLRKLSPSSAMEAESVGQDRLAYLRGSAEDEMKNGGALRNRETVLGDLVNSEPAEVGPPLSYYPDDIAEDSYRDFANARAARTHVLYVGGNDGMLHSFLASTGDELFAYVPRALYPKLSALTAVSYTGAHGFYVDGGPTAADAWLSDGRDWRTVLVGGLGAGGAGIFALDVTDPTAFQSTESAARNRVLWDITGADAGFGDLGFTFSKPAIVRLPDGNLDGAWAAVFGNGYESASGKAVLYIVDVTTGERLAAVVADAGPGNGLSSVAPVDYDGDARVDYIYAGDLKGRMWRFEPDGATGWKVSFNGQPLFKDGTDPVTTTGTQTVYKDQLQWCKKRKSNGVETCDNVPTCTGQNCSNIYTCSCKTVRTTTTVPGTPTTVEGQQQPITVRPEAIRHPKGGIMLLFGTGSYYLTADRTPRTDRINTFYGIWDRLDASDNGNIRDWHLLEQRIEQETTLRSFDIRLTSSNAIVWHDDPESPKPESNPPQTHLGWYLKLVDPTTRLGKGEIQVTEPQARAGRIIFTTMIPSTVVCDFGGEGWLMELNALDGRPIAEPLFDLNGDGVFSLADMATVQGDDGQTSHVNPTGKKSTVGIIQEPAIISAGAKEFKFASGAREARIEVTTESPGGEPAGRRSWLQLH